MDNKKLASELVRLAKELSATDVNNSDKDVVALHDIRTTLIESSKKLSPYFSDDNKPVGKAAKEAAKLIDDAAMVIWKKMLFAKKG